MMFCDHSQFSTSMYCNQILAGILTIRESGTFRQNKNRVLVSIFQPPFGLSSSGCAFGLTVELHFNLLAQGQLLVQHFNLLRLGPKQNLERNYFTTFQHILTILNLLYCEQNILIKFLVLLFLPTSLPTVLPFILLSHSRRSIKVLT